MITLADQIRCVAREVALRRNLYARRVENGSMKQATAAHEIACMEAVLATVQKAAKAEETNRDGLPRGDPTAG